MSYVIFRYQNSDLTIQCEETELFSNIIQKFCTKTQIDKNKLTFVCNGNQVNEELPLSQFPLNENETTRIVLALDIVEENNEECMKKSDNIICPQCKESIVISVKDYKVSLFQCKNGHKIENLSLSKFNETQNIDISQIFCGVCGKSKAEISQNKMFICNYCKLNLCLICNEKHDKSHNIIKYEDKDYICQKDGEGFNLYCKDCKKNICSSCEYEHIDHDTITFGRLMKNKNEFALEYYKLEADIFKFKNTINDIISKLNKLIEYINIYYEINTKIFNSIRRKYRNSEELLSINEINNNRIIVDLNYIINEKNISKKITSIMELYKVMEGEKNEDNLNNLNTNIINNESNINNINTDTKNNINIVNNDKKVDEPKIEKIAINTSENKVNDNNTNTNNNIKVNNHKGNNDNINNDINNNINNNNINNDKINSNSNNNPNESNNIINNNSNNNANDTNRSNNINNNTGNTNNINNETNRNNITPGANNINSNYDDFCFAENILNSEQMNQIRADIDESMPLISESFSIQNLIDDYKDNTAYINSVKKIAEKYKFIRKIRRDGNCFYRGFIYRLFEQLSLNYNNSLAEKISRKIDEIKELVNKNEKISDLFNSFYEVFSGLFYSCCTSINNNDITSNKNYLDNMFKNTNKEKCSYLICFLRYGIAEYLRQNQSLYEPYIEGDDFISWINREVETMDSEAEQIQIIACTNLFDIGIKIEQLNKEKNEVLKYPEDKQDNEIFIKFLYAGGHYDILYD